jgi:hypothetical protein
VLSLVGDEGINGPDSVGKTRLVKLSPYSSLSVGSGIGNVDGDRSLVRAVNDIVTAGVVVPF